MSDTTKEIRYHEEEAIKSLLIGRRIVKAEVGNFVVPSRSPYGDPATGRLTLDNGAEVFIAPNVGGCACSAGDYEIAKLATVDNAISDVQLIEDGEEDEYGEGPTTYRIHVVADAIEMDVVTIEGDDGNGYYGTGYSLYVVTPDQVGATPS